MDEKRPTPRGRFFVCEAVAVMFDPTNFCFDGWLEAVGFKTIQP